MTDGLTFTVAAAVLRHRDLAAAGTRYVGGSLTWWMACSVDDSAGERCLREWEELDGWLVSSSTSDFYRGGVGIVESRRVTVDSLGIVWNAQRVFVIQRTRMSCGLERPSTLQTTGAHTGGTGFAKTFVRTAPEALQPSGHCRHIAV